MNKMVCVSDGWWTGDAEEVETVSVGKRVYVRAPACSEGNRLLHLPTMGIQGFCRVAHALQPVQRSAKCFRVHIGCGAHVGGREEMDANDAARAKWGECLYMGVSMSGWQRREDAIARDGPWLR